MTGRLQPRVAIAALALLSLALAALILPVAAWLHIALQWTRVHREFSALAYFGLYVLATVAFVPGLLLTVAGGALFGLAAGTALVSVSSVAGATAAFLVARTLGGEWVARRIEHSPRLAALDRAVRSRGLWIVVLTRLSPVLPFNALNYLYGISAVRLRDYLLGSWIGMLPATVLYVYAGAATVRLAHAAGDPVRTGEAGRVLFGFGLAASVVTAVWVSRLARRELDRELGR